MCSPGYLPYFSSLSRLANLRDILEIQGIVPAKIHRPYLIGGLSATQRGEKIISHYQRVEQLKQSELKHFLAGERRDQPLLSWLGKTMN